MIKGRRKIKNKIKGINEIPNVNGLLPKRTSCFDKLSMSGKVT